MKLAPIFFFIFSPFYYFFISYLPSFSVYLSSFWFLNLILFSLFVYYTFKYNYAKISVFSIYLFLVFFLFSLIEFFHFINNKLIYDELGINFIKVILYNSYHGSILNCILILAFFSSLKYYDFKNLIIRYVDFNLNLIPLYIIFFLLIKLSIIPSFQESLSFGFNGISYHFLFLYLFKLYINNFNEHSKWLNFLGLLIVILINETRGAFLILFIILFTLLLFRYYKIVIPVLLFSAIIFSLNFNYLFDNYINYLDLIFGESFAYNLVSFYRIFEEFNIKELSSFTQKDLSFLSSEQSFSSYTRIIINIVSFSFFLENPFFGIGYYPTNLIEFGGDSIHSFIFYLPSASGFFGVILFLFFFFLIHKYYNTSDNLLLRYVLIFSLLILQNQLPIYLLVFFLNKSDFEEYGFK